MQNVTVKQVRSTLNSALSVLKTSAMHTYTNKTSKRKTNVRSVCYAFNSYSMCVVLQNLLQKTYNKSIKVKICNAKYAHSFSYYLRITKVVL